MSWPEILHENCRSKVLAVMRKAASSRVSFCTDAEVVTALGVTKRVQIVGDCPRIGTLRGFVVEFPQQGSDAAGSAFTSHGDTESGATVAEFIASLPIPTIAYEWESGRVIEANAAILQDYGFTLDELSGMHFSELWPTDLAPDIRDLKSKVNPDRPFSVQTLHRRKNGTQVEVEVSVHPARINHRRVRVLICRNISETKRVERNLLLSNERLSLLARIAGAVVGSLPLDEQASLMASQIQEAFSVDACVIRLLREDRLDLLASSGVERQALADRIFSGEGLPAKVIVAGAPISVFDVRESGDLPPLDSPDYSRYAFVSYAGAPLVVKDQVIGVVGIFTETELREFSATDLAHLQIVANNLAIAVHNHQLYDELQDHRSTLETSEERLRLITEASTDGIWEWDRASDAFTWSERIYDLLGIKNSGAIPRTASALGIVHREDRPSLRLGVIRNIRHGRQFRQEVRLRRGNGTYGHFEANGRVVRDKNDRVVRIVGSIHDISERVQRDRELEAVAMISLALREVETTREMLPVISDQIVKTLGIESLGLGIVEPASERVVIRHATGVFSDLVGEEFARGEGLIGKVFTDAKVKFAPNLRDEPRSVVREVGTTPTAVLGVPLVARGEVIGVLWLGKSSEPGYEHAAFNPGEARVLAILAEIAAASLRRAGLRERTEFHLRRLRSLSIIHASVSENRDLTTTLNVLLDQLRSQTLVDSALIHTYDEAEGLFHMVGSVGLDDGVELPPLGRNLVISRCNGNLVDLLEQGVRGRRFAKMIAWGYTSYLAVPLIANEQVLGLMEIFHKSELPQNVELDTFAEMLASQAAIAVDNTNLLKSLRSANRELTAAYDATIEGWARALDLRDHETEGHTRRVTEMTVELAKLMKVPAAEIAHMRRGALLHDIGKMAIPDSVLLKPGELDQNEWVIMKRHPGIALDLLEPVSFLKPAIEIPFCHHEKWDGSGYPRGLKGKEIPLCARIFAVIDVWDALRSDRPYRKGWSAEQAVHFIRVQSGRHFDPDVAEAFLSNRELIDRCSR